MPDELKAIETRMRRTAELCLQAAQKAGARQAAVKISRSRFTEAGFRDGDLDKAISSAKQRLTLRLFIKGRYGVHFTNDLRPQALEKFINDAADLTRLLEPDPWRSLPGPGRYPQPPGPDLEIFDPALAKTQPEHWLDLGRNMESLAREEGAGKGAKLISSYGGAYAEVSQGLLANSDGFAGVQAETGAFAGCSVVLLDSNNQAKRRSGWCWEGGRDLAGLRDKARLQDIAHKAGARAWGQMGAKPGPTGRAAVLVENRAAGKLVGQLLRALSGRALHLKRSYLSGKQGQKVASPLLTLQDRPLLKGGLASAWFDGEGMARQTLSLIEAGNLSNYYLDTYYAKALGLPPTTGSSSNVVLPASGSQKLDELEAAMDRGLVATSFLGGNFNSTTGDFSYGVRGRWVEGGKKAFAVEGMNLAGNAADLWGSLAAVGADPYLISAVRAPSLLFSEVQLSGA
ncbi:MAG: TldD/PmbA family protein [Desulfarculaceae bacterium]|jgi:PmbA protein